MTLQLMQLFINSLKIMEQMPTNYKQQDLSVASTETQLRHSHVATIKQTKQESQLLAGKLSTSQRCDIPFLLTKMETNKKKTAR